MRLRIVRVHSMHVASRATNREVYLSPLAQGSRCDAKGALHAGTGVGVSADRGRGIPFDRTRSKRFQLFSFWVLTSFQLEVNLHMVAELLREL